MFIHYKDIAIEKKITWNSKVILTFDIDWASDEVLNYLVDILEKASVKCSFFVTHQTEVLNRIRANPNFELGIHPNFNPLLNGNSKLTADQIISELIQIVPEAKVIRSHSLTTSGSWLGLYKKYGFSYISNYMMNGVENIQPFYQINGLIEVPIYYADDGDIYLSDNLEISRLQTDLDLRKPFDGIKVFNFHPIHIALNTKSVSQYQNAKANQSSLNAIFKFRSEGQGSETSLLKLLQYGKQ